MVLVCDNNSTILIIFFLKNYNALLIRKKSNMDNNLTILAYNLVLTLRSSRVKGSTSVAMREEGLTSSGVEGSTSVAMREEGLTSSGVEGSTTVAMREEGLMTMAMARVRGRAAGTQGRGRMGTTGSRGRERGRMRVIDCSLYLSKEWGLSNYINHFT
jgi:hypothetical protein